MVPGDTEYVIAYNPSRRRMLLVINEGGGSGGNGNLKELTASIFIVGVVVPIENETKKGVAPYLPFQKGNPCKCITSFIFFLF